MPMYAQSTLQRLPISRQTILLGIVFGISLVIGLVASALFLATPQSKVSQVNYVAVVALLYAQNHDLAAARAQIATIGDPKEVVSTVTTRVTTDQTVKN